jgi:hypothetical protein
MSGRDAIEGVIRHRDGREVCRVWLKAIPAVGETVVLGGWQGKALLDKEGTARFRVAAVTHACIAEMTQGSRRGTEPDHDVILSVDPVPSLG